MQSDFWFIALFLCTTFNLNVAESEMCVAKLSPSIQYELLQNDSLTVYCTLENVTPNCISANMSFYDRDKRIASEYVDLVNSTTIKLTLPNLQANEKTFMCKYNNTIGLEPFVVRVGYKPKPIDLKCISKNFHIMECSFEEHENPVRPKYTLTYWQSTKQKTDSDKCTYQYPYQITVCNLTQTRNIKVCRIEMLRKAWNYTFEVKSENSLGEECQEFSFDIKRTVIPDSPENVEVSNITSRSVVLTWHLPYNFRHFNHPFTHRVLLKYANYTNADWRNVSTDAVTVAEDRTKFQLLINDLEYAHTWYNVRISYRVENPYYGDDQWSNHTGITFVTASRKPDMPPETDIGAFYIDTEKNILNIYWKEIAVDKRNGNNLTYKFYEILENDILTTNLKLKPKSFTATMARFEQMNKNSNYKFKLITENSEGRSSGHSIINIPKPDQLLPSATNLKKVLTNSIYTLTWDKPINNGSQNYTISNYTIFWCVPTDEQTSLCAETIDFDHVDASKEKYIYNNTIDKKPKIFAISTNSYKSSSGMTWFPCSATNTSDMTKLKITMEVLNASSIKISWTLPCDATPLLQGYNISYCIINDPFIGDCKYPEQKLYYPSRRDQSDHFVIRDLLAYTTYQVRTAMYNGEKTGPFVESRNTTESGIPTSPSNLEATEVFNNSVKLQWDPPQYWNGEPQSYIIKYYMINKDGGFGEENHKNVIKKSDTLPSNFKLEGLTSFAKYRISIAGCNPISSNYSNEIEINTKVGKPKQVSLNEKDGNRDNPVYTWIPPTDKGGNIDFYEVLVEIKIKGKDQRKMFATLNGTGTRCSLTKNLCVDNVEEYKISVRAVNMVERIDRHELPKNILHQKNDQYHSSGSHQVTKRNVEDMVKCEEAFEDNDQDNLIQKCNYDFECIAGEWNQTNTDCHYGSDESFTFVLIVCGVVILVLIVLVIVGVGTKKFQKMRDIGVELPDGLQDIDKVKPTVENIKIDKNENMLDNEQTMRLIGTDNKSASICSLDNKSQSSDFIDSDNENTLNDENLTNPAMYGTMADTSSLTENIKTDEVIQKRILPSQISNPLNNIHTTMPILSNGYVSNAMFSPSSNGYVQHSAIMPIPISSNGYTSIAAFNKIEPKIEIAKTPIVASTNGISGYVTNKQLSEFHNTLMQ